MKKILLIAVALMLIPFTAMATMTAISDADMEAVTGQAGVTLAPIDFSLDLNIKNIAYTDPDTGVLEVAGIANVHSGGTFNIHDLQIVNLHETLNGTAIFNSVASDAGSATFIGVQAKAVEIDLVSFGSVGVPLWELRNRTGVVISGPDMRLTIDEVKLDMTLDTDGEDVEVAWSHNSDLYDMLGQVDADGYEYTATPDNTQSFGDVVIQGIELILYAYPRIVIGDDGAIGPVTIGTANMYKEYVANTDDVASALDAGLKKGVLGTGGDLELGDAFNNHHRAQLIISPH